MKEKDQTNQSDNPTADIFDAKLLIGMTKEQSNTYLDYHNIIHRIVAEDDHEYVVEANAIHPDLKRYNITIVKNKVSAYNIG